MSVTHIYSHAEDRELAFARLRQSHAYVTPVGSSASLIGRVTIVLVTVIVIVFVCMCVYIYIYIVVVDTKGLICDLRASVTN